MPDVIQIMRGIGKKALEGTGEEFEVPLWLLSARTQDGQQVAIALEEGSLNAVRRMLESAEQLGSTETLAWSGGHIPKEPSQADVVEETTKGAHAAMSK